MPQPTEEQVRALGRFRSGRPLKINAFAGAGKTTTLKLLAESRSTRGTYLAFNRSIANEAAEKFPRTVDCRTTHSLAWQAVQSTHRFSTGKMNGKLYANQLAETLELKDETFGRELRLRAVHQAHLLLRTLRNFCQSADPAIGREHVPQYGRLLGASRPVLEEVRAWAISTSKGLWDRMVNHRDAIPLGHDGYLKLWALGRPKLGSQYILLDEAQDTNAVVLGVLADQAAQIVYVGDKYQQIYEWRGAINAMEKIEGCEEVSLTQSFRFGIAIAEAATRVLETLGETETVRGNPDVSSAIAPSGDTRVVLARTNATVILEVLTAIEAGRRPHVVGGTEELKRLLSDVYELKRGNPGSCPEFFGFTNWADVVAFAETEEGEDIRMFVQLVEKHGENKLWAAVTKAEGKEEKADLILSTAHKAKGREWDSVRLAPDFLSSRLNGVDPNAEAEVRLFYVAMTRAKRLLVVEPELLDTFTSGGWQALRPEPRQRQEPRPRPVTAPVPPRSAPRPVVVAVPDEAPTIRAPAPAATRPEVPQPSHGSGNGQAQPPPFPNEVRLPPLPAASEQAEGAAARARSWWRFWE
jgi:UvrD-like helicase family protein